MELRSAISWKDEVEAALEKLWGVVRPAPARAPQRPDAADAAYARLSGPGTHDAPAAPWRSAPGRGGCCDSGAASTQMKSASSLSSAALGLAPTMDLTTSPSL